MYSDSFGLFRDINNVPKWGNHINVDTSVGAVRVLEWHISRFILYAIDIYSTIQYWPYGFWTGTTPKFEQNVFDCECAGSISRKLKAHKNNEKFSK